MEPIAEQSSPLLPGRKIPKKTKRSLRNAGSSPSSIQPPPVSIQAPPVSSTHTEDIAEDITISSQSLQVPTVQPAVLPTAQDVNPVLQTTAPTLPVVSRRFRN